MTKKNIRELISLHDPREFDRRFIKKTRQYKTYEEAYRAVETEYRKVFGTTKYASYNSYRNARRLRIKKKNKNQ